MLNYIYTAYNERGEKIQAKIEAEKEDDVIAFLLKKGFTPIAIKQHREELVNTAVVTNILFHRVPAKEKVVFARQLATMLNAGLPIAQSLRSLENQTSNRRLKEIIRNLTSDIEQGGTLSGSLSRYPDVFSNLFIQLIAAGEASGTLNQILLRLANQLEKSQSLTRKVRGALIYPAFILTALGAVAIVMLSFVIPKLEDLYKSFGSELPTFTRIMFGAARVALNLWFPIIIAIVAGYVGFRILVKTPSGRWWWDKTKLKMPLFGQILRKVYIARFTRTLSTLLSSGIAILESLQIVSATIDNKVLEKIVLDARNEVKNGVAMAVPFKKSPEFPDIVGQMIEVGQETGELDDVLLKLADYYDEEVDTAVKNISTLIEPVLLLFMGILVAFFMIAIMMPIYSMIQSNMFNQV